MAVTGMQIYKVLPKTNCKECGVPTCMAFAMQVVSNQRTLTDCPHLSGTDNDELSSISAPPMRLVSIGNHNKPYEIGQETVMYRHEERFQRPSGIAIRLSSSLSVQEIKEKIKKIDAFTFERIGKQLQVSFYAMEIDGCTNPAERAMIVAKATEKPIILLGEIGERVRAAVEAIKEYKPLIYRANSMNINEYSEIASINNVPLAIGGESLQELADVVNTAQEAGVKEIILSFNGNDVKTIFESLTVTRRAALTKKFNQFGYPSMVEIAAENPDSETLLSSIFATKYSGIVLIDHFLEWELLPILTAIQDIYNDPQVPNKVEPKLYEVGKTTQESPVLFTTNFSLSYFSVVSEIERSKVPAFICVVDTDGLGVLNAYAGDKISVEKVLQTLKAQEVTSKVTHRKLIIPGLLPIFKAEIEENSEWKEVIIGPENAREIPVFLNKVWS
ncbi:acetyl-CoA decarbonylase/synthase complex subunit gamma [Chlamydiota bacterium]